MFYANQCFVFVFDIVFSRLVRVRQIQEEHPRRQTIEEDGLSLFDDYAYLDRENKSFRIGRLQRMRRNINNRCVEYKDTVSFSETYLSDIEASFIQYKQNEQNETVFSLKEFSVVSTKASDVITHVNLTYDNSDSYLLPENELKLIKSFVEKTFTKPKTMRTQKAHRQVNSDFDGQFSVEVVPKASADGRRVSMRKRREKHYLS